MDMEKMAINEMNEVIKEVQMAAEKQFAITDLYIELEKNLTSKAESGLDINVAIAKKINEFAVMSQRLSKEFVEYAGKLIGDSE